ncbi:MAG: hypothetical protein LBP80_10035 [Treponema sp.]|jgi:hypothetical protein|nr:hypothetical protein [Treponema sp.]
MRKTITNFLVPAVSLLCLLALNACPPEATPPEDTEAVRITNIPREVGANKKAPFKVYVQLSAGMDASAGYVAKGEAKLPSPETTEITIKLKDQKDDDWTGSGFTNVCVLVSPETVNNIDDIDAKPQASATSSKTLVLDWNNLMEERFINTLDKYSLAKLYNGIVVDDLDIKGSKTREKDSD